MLHVVNQTWHPGHTWSSRTWQRAARLRRECWAKRSSCFICRRWFGLGPRLQRSRFFRGFGWILEAKIGKTSSKFWDLPKKMGEFITKHVDFTSKHWMSPTKHWDLTQKNRSSVGVHHKKSWVKQPCTKIWISLIWRRYTVVADNPGVGIIGKLRVKRYFLLAKRGHMTKNTDVDHHTLVYNCITV